MQANRGKNDILGKINVILASKALRLLTFMAQGY